MHSRGCRRTVGTVNGFTTNVPALSMRAVSVMANAI